MRCGGPSRPELAWVQGRGRGGTVVSAGMKVEWAMGEIGAPELVLILVVLVLLFGAKKLPDLARGSGRALRIFKSEVRGLGDTDAADPPTGSPNATGQSDQPTDPDDRQRQ